MEIIEYCEPEKCIEREQYYINNLPHEYNILPNAGSSLGFKHSEEMVAKLSASKKGENNPMFGKKGNDHPSFGKIHSEETLAKMSATQKTIDRSGAKHPRLGKTHSEETREKLSIAMKGKSRAKEAGRPSQKIEVFDKKNNQTTYYDSIHEAARALNIRQNVISMYFKNNQKKAYKERFIFKKK